MNDVLQSFLLGVLVTACAVIGLFFLRFWRRSHDRLFLAFAGAFWLFGTNWAMLAVLNHGEGYPAIYLFRLMGFGLIVAGIIAKNRNNRPHQRRSLDRIAASTIPPERGSHEVNS